MRKLYRKVEKTGKKTRTLRIQQAMLYARNKPGGPLNTVNTVGT